MQSDKVNDMYFPSVMMPLKVSTRTVSVTVGGTHIVFQDSFDPDDTIDHMISYIMKTSAGNIQEIKISGPEV